MRLPVGRRQGGVAATFLQFQVGAGAARHRCLYALAMGESGKWERLAVSP